MKFVKVRQLKINFSLAKKAGIIQGYGLPYSFTENKIPTPDLTSGLLFLHNLPMGRDWRYNCRRFP